MKIPRIDFAFINGSGTWACNFPEDCNDPSVKMLEDNLVFDTPFGPTIPLKLIRFEAQEEGTIAKDVLIVPMHGNHFDSAFTRDQGTDQIFWLLQQAGVRKIISEASVGGINPLLEPGDLLVPDDFIELRVNRGMAFDTRDQRMRDPFCPALRRLLLEEARKIFPRVMRRGVAICSEGPRFETVAEVRMMHQMGGDVVGMTLTPEIYYARAIGACFGLVNIIANGAEGAGLEWGELDEMQNRYRGFAVPVGQVVLNAMKRCRLEEECSCHLYGPIEMDRIRPNAYPKQ